MKIFRRRFIPNEIIDISGDEVVFRDDKKLITRWLPIKPRPDIGSGMSCIYFDKGIKISKIFDKSGNFKHWYCDIIKHEYIKKKDKYIVTDLLVDVVVYPDGHYEVLDLEELDEALKEINDHNREVVELPTIPDDIKFTDFIEYVKEHENVKAITL